MARRARTVVRVDQAENYDQTEDQDRDQYEGEDEPREPEHPEPGAGKMAWIIAGPSSGKFLMMAETDLQRGIEYGWAEDPEGRSSLDMATPTNAVAPDYDLWINGQASDPANLPTPPEAPPEPEPEPEEPPLITPQR